MERDQRSLEEVVVAGFVMLREAVRPVGPVRDLTVGGDALFFCANVRTPPGPPPIAARV
jgi:hypothetical protein